MNAPLYTACKAGSPINSRTRGMHHVVPVRHQRFADDLIVAVQRQLAVFDQVFQEGGDILGVHLAGVIRNGGRQIQRPVDADAALHHHFAGTRQFAVAAALGGDIHNQRAGRHARHHFRGDQDGRFLAGHGGGGDHHVLLGQHAGHGLALAPVEIFAHGLGVAALVFGRVGLHIQHHEARAQAFDLLLHGGADIVAADHALPGAAPWRWPAGRQRRRRSPARAPAPRCRRRSSAWGTCGAGNRRRSAPLCSRRWSPWKRARPCSARA